MVPKGNPDQFNFRGTLIWKAYDVNDLIAGDTEKAGYEIVHGGYMPFEVLEDINRLAPVNIMRALEKEKIIGQFHPYFYSTTGNATSSKVCHKMGEEIAEEMIKNQVSAAILTST